MTLADIARTAVTRSAAWNATNHTVGSTFTRGNVRGGAVWFWQAPPEADGTEGHMYMMRVSPRRALLDLQVAAGTTPDAKYGPATRAAILRMTGAPSTSNDANVIISGLVAVYHGNRGTIYMPERTEFPTSANPTEVRGDETYLDAIDLTTNRTIPIPRTAGAEHAADELARVTAATTPTATTRAPATQSPAASLTSEQRAAMGLATTPRGDVAPLPAPMPPHDLVVENVRPVADAPAAGAALMAPPQAAKGLVGWIHENPGTAGLAGFALIGAGVYAMKAATTKRKAA